VCRGPSSAAWLAQGVQFSPGLFFQNSALFTENALPCSENLCAYEVLKANIFKTPLLHHYQWF